ncbi:hypothetical protein D9M69_466180 [compost metagenome]
MQRDEDVERLARQIHRMRITPLHPLLWDCPRRALEIDLIPGGLDQFALAHQRQQDQAQRQLDGRIGRHRFQLLHHQPDFQRRQGAILRHEGGDRGRSHAVGGVDHLFPMGDGVDVDLLHDVPDLHRGGWRPALLDLVAQDPEVLGLDFGQQAVLEDRQDVPVDDVHACGAGAVGPFRMSEERLHRRAEGLDGANPAFVALLLQRGRDALENGFARLQEQFARHCQRYAARPVAADGQGLAASVETVVVAEGDGICGRYRHVHPIPVRNLISQRLRLQIAQRCVGQHRGFLLFF